MFPGIVALQISTKGSSSMSDNPKSSTNETNNYVLLDPEFELVMPYPLTNPEVYLRNVFKQNVPDDTILSDREKLLRWQNPDDDLVQSLLESIKRDTEVQKRGREVFTYSDDKAYSDHFDATIGSTWAREVGSEKGEVQLDESQMADLTIELKAESVRTRYESEVRIDRGKGMSILFQGRGNDEIVAKQIIGNPTSPAFVIEQLWKRPGGERRILYRNDTSKIETQRDGKNATRRAITDIKPAMSMAREYFIGVRSGLDIREGTPYEADNDEHRILFLKCYNKLWLVDAVEALVESFRTPQRD
jgi:hypothetical protein